MSFADPTAIINYLDISSPMTVVDLGAGSGAYTLAAAQKVLPDGKVYAVDIQKDLLERIKLMAKKQNFFNVEVICGDLERAGGTNLADGVADAVILSNILFQISAPYLLVNEIKRLLKRGGKVLLVEWSDSFGGLGPKAEAVVSASRALEMFTPAGFGKVKDFPAGDHHYGLILVKN